VAALAALSAEPGGATVAVIAARTGISMPAARQVLLAHEKNGTATRIKGRRPGIADTWTPAAPLGRRPHDLRHTAVSLWLNSGVPATEVARRAGHGVAVLLKIYAHCIDGQANAANQRITDASAPPRQSRTPATRATTGPHQRQIPAGPALPGRTRGRSGYHSGGIWLRTGLTVPCSPPWPGRCPGACGCTGS
jgi:hypothetical protein